MGGMRHTGRYEPKIPVDAARVSRLCLHRGRRHRRLRNVAQFHRLLGLQVAPPPPLRPEPGAFGRTRAALTDHVAWRACAYLLLKLLLSLVGAICMIYLLLWGLPYLTFPIWWEILHVHGVVVGVPGWLTWWKPDPSVDEGDASELVS